MNQAPIVAIVDDDPSLRRSLLRVVEAAGYNTVGFPGGREFLDSRPSGRIACAVLDVHMPEMSGFDVYSQISIPTIFITAHDDAVTRDRVARSGATHLLKPFDATALLEAIQRVLGIC